MDAEELWVGRIVDQPAIEVTTNRDSFDVYIDEVRFLPDGATVIKVNNHVAQFFFILTIDPKWRPKIQIS